MSAMEQCSICTVLARKPLHRWSWSAAQIQARRANSTRQILLRTSLSASVTPFRKGKIS